MHLSLASFCIPNEYIKQPFRKTNIEVRVRIKG